MIRGASNDKKVVHYALMAEMATSNSFVFSRIDFIFRTVLPWDNKHQPPTNLVATASTVTSNTLTTFIESIFGVKFL